MENEYFIKNVLEKPNRNVEFAAAAVYADIIEDLSRANPTVSRFGSGVEIVDPISDDDDLFDDLIVQPIISIYDDDGYHKIYSILHNEELRWEFSVRLIDKYKSSTDAFERMIISKGLIYGTWYYVDDTKASVLTIEPFWHKPGIQGKMRMDIQVYATSLLQYMVDNHYYMVDVMSFVADMGYDKTVNNNTDVAPAILQLIYTFDYEQIYDCLDFIFVLSVIFNRAVWMYKARYGDLESYLDIVFDIIVAIGNDDDAVVTDPTYDPMLYETQLQELLYLKPIVELKMTLRYHAYRKSQSFKGNISPDRSMLKYFENKCMEYYDNNKDCMYNDAIIAYIDFILDVLQVNAIASMDEIKKYNRLRSIVVKQTECERLAFMTKHELPMSEMYIAPIKYKPIVVGLKSLITPPLDPDAFDVSQILRSYTIDKDISKILPQFGLYETQEETQYKIDNCRNVDALVGSHVGSEIAVNIGGIKFDRTRDSRYFHFLSDSTKMKYYIDAETSWFNLWRYTKSRKDLHSALLSALTNMGCLDIESVVIITFSIYRYINGDISIQTCLTDLVPAFKSYVRWGFEHTLENKSSTTFENIIMSEWGFQFLGEYREWFNCLISGAGIDKRKSYNLDMTCEFFIFLVTKFIIGKGYDVDSN